MQDENAFGLWVAYFDIEEDEYGADETEPFVARFTLFERLVLEHLAGAELARGLRASSLGHGVYLEWEEGEQVEGPIGWMKRLRGLLSEHSFRSTCALTHGGRWLSDDQAPCRAGSVELQIVSRPSEPLRRALFLDAATHGAPDEDTAWGPGLYVDTEAIEALKLTPKNRPTTLRVAGADFYRLGS